MSELSETTKAPDVQPPSSADLDVGHVDALRHAIQRGDGRAILNLLADEHPAELADRFEQ